MKTFYEDHWVNTKSSRTEWQQKRLPAAVRGSEESLAAVSFLMENT